MKSFSSTSQHSQTTSLPLLELLDPAALLGRSWAWCLCAGVLACGGRVEGSEALDAARPGHASLRLVQSLDQTELHDGDASGFARADLSQGLLHGRAPAPSAASERRGACNADPRVLLGQVSLDTCIGADLFFRESFGGNGRTCGSCHPAANNFTLDPSFIESLPPDDPLFVSEQDPALAELELPELLRDFALIRVNPDGREDPTGKFVMRSVSHIWSMSTSIAAPPVIFADGETLDGTTDPPVQRTGWSGDGAPGDGSLLRFAQGAIEQHATRSLARAPYRDFFAASDTQLRQLEEFQLSLGRRNELDLTQVSLSDAGAERGRQSFLTGPARDCNACHSNAGANTLVTDRRDNSVTADNMSFDTGSERARLPVLSELGVPFDGGFGQKDFDADGDGKPDAFGNGLFNVQPLIEAADTGPFFHTNAFGTLEEAIAFYTTDTFGNSPAGSVALEGSQAGPMPLTPQDVLDVGRFLRVLNAAFNCQIALTRLQAVWQISDAFGNRFISIQRGLLELAQLEMQDALDDLGQVPDLDSQASEQLLKADGELARARRSLDQEERRQRTRAALLLVAGADASLGTGMRYQIGEGALMF